MAKVNHEARNERIAEFQKTANCTKAEARVLVIALENSNKSRGIEPYGPEDIVVGDMGRGHEWAHEV